MALTALAALTALTLLHAAPPAHARTPMVVSSTSWGDEFCRAKYCGTMPSSRWGLCCHAYRQCCAYVDLLSGGDPLSVKNSEEEAAELLSPRPQVSKESTGQSARLFEYMPVAARRTQRPPSRSLKASPTPPKAHPTLFLALLPQETDLPMDSLYNEDLIDKQERVCQTGYCSLMSSSGQTLCCQAYRKCCAYSNLRMQYDVLHPDMNTRRR